MTFAQTTSYSPRRQAIALATELGYEAAFLAYLKRATMHDVILRLQAMRGAAQC